MSERNLSNDLSATIHSSSREFMLCPLEKPTSCSCKYALRYFSADNWQCIVVVRGNGPSTEFSAKPAVPRSLSAFASQLRVSACMDKLFSQHRHLNTMTFRCFDGDLITRVSMSDYAHAWICRQD